MVINYSSKETENRIASLTLVCTEAGMFALRERRVHVTQEDFEMAVAKVMKKETKKNTSLRKLWNFSDEKSLGLFITERYMKKVKINVITTITSTIIKAKKKTLTKEATVSSFSLNGFQEQYLHISSFSDEKSLGLFITERYMKKVKINVITTITSTIIKAKKKTLTKEA
ncbi:hypothetical protein Syun_011034 [Stephania yunnanensis]|uniref:Uncharacterized protein n=1 Tax=Stephania yunnanensis TaxID=152371 RepID=A0AAP0JXI7_9MAGN